MDKELQITEGISGTFHYHLSIAGKTGRTQKVQERRISHDHGNAADL